jgi:hypothetical protein
MARTKKEITELMDSECNTFATLTKDGWNWNYKRLNKLNINMKLRDYVKLFDKAGCYIPELGRTLNAEIPKAIQRQERTKSKAEIKADIKSIFDLDSLGSVTFVIEDNELIAQNADGGHRSRCTCGVVSNEIGYEYDKNTTIYLKDLTEEHQERILDSTINVEIISGEDADLFDIFIRRNSGKPVNTMEKLHAEFGQTSVWQLAEELGNLSYIDSLFKTNGINHDNGYRKTGTILQILAMMNFLAERQEEEPAQYHYSKNIARKQFLKDNKEMKKKDLNKLKKEFILIFDAFKNNKLITEGFYARHKGRRADNMNGVNASVALKKIIEDNSPAMKDRILEKVAEVDMVTKLQDALNVFEPDLSKRPYAIACKDGKDIIKQLTELENAFISALNM